MSLATTITHLRTDVENSLSTFYQQNLDPPKHLLESMVLVLLMEFLSSSRSGEGSMSYAEPQERLTYQNLDAAPQDTIKQSSGNIFSLAACNIAVGTRWIQLFDSNTGVQEGDIPKESYAIFTESFLVLDSNYFGEKGISFDSGISFGFSSKNDSFVPSTDSFELHVKYR